ncbi:SMP-30/gluconolactonase/LRE family protein [Arenibacter sp. ARW7G5Y1]|uniref:SMP-30/gluconolactonase/LRE family protein n=1 Tax=Arenibacter sp. ARW7G5Y1 TaxID=2135619 RepID=UPI000D762B5C|nr:SMP-30/gluconolactonase/LRE family protein [Arenibacter sp. ARW7G5Y1]PXX30580.1 sugar lactone lactonase YvrE [Arenibacter sp. ARW7G5Y1]
MKLVKVVVDCKNDLGEGPVWDQVNGKLLWVDYNNGKICQYNPKLKAYSFIEIADTVMVTIPTNRNNWIVAIDKNVSIYDPNNKHFVKKVTIQENKPNNRLNDGKCDAKNRLWIGTMSTTADAPVGALYKVNADLTYQKMDEPFIIPNGIAWNKENTVMYVVDSMMKKIFSYDFNLENGTISNKTVFIDTSNERGLPDGMTIDADGNLWVAFWQGQSILCYETKSGKVLKRIIVPTVIPSSCCFGDEDLGTLYITSSRRYDTVENIENFPFAGGLFSFKPGVKGLPTQIFNES